MFKIKNMVGLIAVLFVLCATAHLYAEERFHGEPDSVTRPGERFKKANMMVSGDTLKLKIKKPNYEVSITTVTYSTITASSVKQVNNKLTTKTKQIKK